MSRLTGRVGFHISQVPYLLCCQDTGSTGSVDRMRWGSLAGRAALLTRAGDDAQRSDEEEPPMTRAAMHSEAMRRSGAYISVGHAGSKLPRSIGFRGNVGMPDAAAVATVRSGRSRRPATQPRP